MEIVIGLIIGLAVGGGFAFVFYRQAAAVKSESADCAKTWTMFGGTSRGWN